MKKAEGLTAWAIYALFLLLFSFGVLAFDDKQFVIGAILCGVAGAVHQIWFPVG